MRKASYTNSFFLNRKLKIGIASITIGTLFAISNGVFAENNETGNTASIVAEDQSFNYESNVSSIKNLIHTQLKSKIAEVQSLCTIDLS